MGFSVVQSGAAAGGTVTVTFSQAVTVGNLLIVFDVSNGAGNTASASGHAMTQAAYSASSGGNYAAVFYLANCPSGVTAATLAGTSPYTIGYMEVSGVATAPTVTGGSSTGNGTWNVANPAANASDFTVFSFTYSSSNAGTPFSDGLSGDHVVSNFGQFSYTTTASNSVTSSSATNWAAAAASFTPAAGGVSGTVQPRAVTVARRAGARIVSAHFAGAANQHGPSGVVPVLMTARTEVMSRTTGRIIRR